MYWHMSSLQKETLVIHRGMALHKMLRLITIGLGGDVELNDFSHINNNRDI